MSVIIKKPRPVRGFLLPTGTSSALTHPPRARNLRDMNTTQRLPRPLASPPPLAGEGRCVCGNCKHWTRHTDSRMAYYGQCVARPVGYYTAEQSPCILTPVHWRRA